MASALARPVLTNIRQFRPDVHPLQSPEVDGLIKEDGRRLVIEVKSYRLEHDDIREILSKYDRIVRDELYLVAPSFAAGLLLPRNVHAIPFSPNLTEIQRLYIELNYPLPQDLEDELASGDHHFRYVSACRKKGETTSFRNQIDKRMKSVSQVLRDIRRERRECDVPVRVFWSTSRWLFPKELFHSSYPNELVRRGLVFDIDGSAIHNTFAPCCLMPGETTCSLCINAARETAKQLSNFLAANGLSRLSIVFSGRQGFHVYVLNEKLRESEVQDLVAKVQEAGIKIDANLARDRKSVVTFPGSIHGLTMLRAIPVTDLEGFTVHEARSL
jgi:hypothetical protein